MMKSRLLGLCFSTLLIFQYGLSSAQGVYPDRTVRLIVPQTAGGPSDIVGRLLAQKLTNSLGKSVIVENKPGAGGNIGIDIIAKSKPDGYNLIITIVGILGINETLYKTLPFNVLKDLDGISKIASSPLVLVANPAFEPNTISELITYAKSKPALSISYGSSGTGSPQHIGGELLNIKTGIKLNHIPYKGAAPALMDLLGNQVPLAIVGLPAALPYIKSGKLKAIATFSKSRSKLAPTIPTFYDSGFPEVEAEVVYGVFTTAGTPKPILTELNQKIGEIINSKEVKEKLLSDGFDIALSSPSELNDYLKNEIQKWRPIVQDSGATSD
ncbi:MAG: tripartite tricarboxylate transporter substrate binding protein [Betaproteobacteria bacterium]|jgi:tripartite-type tricarboxylate transporter receptor subunit TctC